ncbi:MAG: hypothetical protein HYU36_22365 [Planctomycetes bacterium]|nr:hypothetical protein [Planctomycetota bacterium]
MKTQETVCPAPCLLAALAIGWPSLSLAQQAVPPASEWQWEKTIVPLALVMPGLWGETFQIDKALDKVGYRQRGDLKDLARYTVIVLVNVPVVRFPEGSINDLREFVSQGGGLVVLGGLSSYANGGYPGTPLDEILPVSLKESYIDHFPSAEKGAKLGPAESADWPLNFDFRAGPTAYYFHTLIPKDGARVQVKVGDLPALVSGSFGNGRVVACALTANGNPEAGVLPFWDWKDWPALLGQALDWAGGARPAGNAAAQDRESGPKPLTEEELDSLEMDLTDMPVDFVARAMATPDERAANVLFDLAAPAEGEEAKYTLDTTLTALLPYSRPAWGEKLKALADDVNPNIKTRQAALVLMGASRSPLAYPALTKALKDDRVDLAAMDGLGLLGNKDGIPLLRRRFEEVLTPARLPEGPDRWKPAEYAEASRPAAHAAIALYRLGDPEGVTRLCEFAANLSLYRRILWNAAKRWPRDPQGQAILKGIIDRAEMLQEAWDFLVGGAGPIPASQGEAFVKYAAAADDPVVIEFLALAMEKSVGSPAKADWQSLSAAKSGILARMARAMILTGGKED